MKTRGKFIVIEGIDGSGTTTQAELFVEMFARKQTPAFLTREPTGGPIGSLIRRMLKGEIEVTTWKAEALLFAADRADHAQQILAKLADGVHVVSDRYDLSSYTYQLLSRPEEEGLELFERTFLLESINKGLPRPDLTVVLDLPASVAEARRAERNTVPEVFEVPEMQKKLAALYARAERSTYGDHIVHVDAYKNVEDVHYEIYAAFERLLYLDQICCEAAEGGAK